MSVTTKHTITRDEWLRLIEGESVIIGGLLKAANRMVWMEVVLEDIGLIQIREDIKKVDLSRR